MVPRATRGHYNNKGLQKIETTITTTTAEYSIFKETVTLCSH